MERKNPKTYDQAFKSLSDRSPRGLLDIFGVLPVEAVAVVEPLPRDLSMRPLAIDSAYMISQPRRKPYIAVFEALTSWERDIAQKLVCYGGLLGIKYRVPIHMYVLPLAKHACPKVAVPVGKSKWGDVSVGTRLRWIKPWEIDAKHVLDRGWPELDPWAVLFDLNGDQELQVMERLSGDGRGEDASLFRLLGGMRYRKNKPVWLALLERMKTMIRPELFLQSLAVEDWREEGRQEGRLMEARAALVSFIRARFRKLDVTPVQKSTDIKALHALIPKIAVAPDRAAVKRLIENLSLAPTA